LTNRNLLLCSKQDWRRQTHVAWRLGNYLQSIKGPKHCPWFCTRYQTIYLPASHRFRWVLQITLWFKIIITHYCIRVVILSSVSPYAVSHYFSYEIRRQMYAVSTSETSVFSRHYRLELCRTHILNVWKCACWVKYL